MAVQLSQNLMLFYSEFLHANTWAQRKDGVPLELLGNLTAEELEIAERELISAAGLNDTWPIRGLGYIRSTASLSKLYGLLERSKGMMSVFLAHAIYSICHDEKMIGITMAETRSLIKKLPRKEYELMDVILLLPDFQNEQINQVLSSLCGSRYDLIAYNAARVSGRLAEGNT